MVKPDRPAMSNGVTTRARIAELMIHLDPLLGGLGAENVLIAFLEAPPPEDAVTRLGEEVVRSAAAKALTQSTHPRVDQVLETVALHEHLPGALEAMAARDPALARPVLIASLEEDFIRDTAAALRRQGVAATSGPVDAALDRGSDSERARRRRRAVLDILLDLGGHAAMWRRLKRLLDDDDAAIVALVSALGVSTSTDPARLAQQLLAVLPRIGWEWMPTVEHLVVEALARAAALARGTLVVRSPVSDRRDVQLVLHRIRGRLSDAGIASIDWTT